VFAGRVTVYYRGRVLQTALLKTNVVDSESEWESQPELLIPLHFAEVWPNLSTLDERRRFDAFVVFNHSTSNEPGMTAAGKDGAYIASLHGIDPQVSQLNALLTQVAHSSKRFGSGLTKNEHNAKLLCDLAMEGNVLYRKLVCDYFDRSPAAQELRKAEYLQIVSLEPDKLVPLEFVYDYPPPKEGAKVCTAAPKALLGSGECPKECLPKVSPAPHVCPLGFWGLRKVIERQKFNDPELPKPAYVKPSQAVPGRSPLPLKGPTLLAASKEVSAAEKARLTKAVKSAWGSGVSAVDKWANWPETVRTTKPVLFVTLPHAEGKDANLCLEISGDVIKSLYIDETYVLADPKNPPVVLLLGCDVANTANTDAYTSHISVFRQAQAALVLGTIATVLGDDAAKVAGKIVKQLASTAKKLPDRFGEVLRQVKRESIANSEMIALCLVAYGDADWRLE
jgi:hypothetical protein